MCGTKLSCRELAKKIKVIRAINCGRSMLLNSFYSFEHTLVLELALRRMRFFWVCPLMVCFFVPLSGAGKPQLAQVGSSSIDICPSLAYFLHE